MSHASADAIGTFPQEVFELSKIELKETIYDIIDRAEDELSGFQTYGTSRNPTKVIDTMTHALDHKVDVLSGQLDTLMTFVRYDRQKTPGQVEDVREAIRDILSLALEADHALFQFERSIGGAPVE